jgi:hypothetical protein
MRPTKINVEIEADGEKTMRRYQLMPRKPRVIKFRHSRFPRSQAVSPMSSKIKLAPLEPQTEQKRKNMICGDL